MGVVAGFVLVLGTALASAMSRQLSDEFKAWTPWLVERMIRLAVRKLPPQFAERLDEEWRSFIDEMPGQIGKVVAAIGFLVASKRLAFSWKRSAGTEKPQKVSRTEVQKEMSLVLRVVLRVSKEVVTAEEYNSEISYALVKGISRLARSIKFSRKR